MVVRRALRYGHEDCPPSGCLPTSSPGDTLHTIGDTTRRRAGSNDAPSEANSRPTGSRSTRRYQGAASPRSQGHSLSRVTITGTPVARSAHRGGTPLGTRRDLPQCFYRRAGASVYQGQRSLDRDTTRDRGREEKSEKVSGHPRIRGCTADASPSFRVLSFVFLARSHVRSPPCRKHTQARCRSCARETTSVSRPAGFSNVRVNRRRCTRTTRAAPAYNAILPTVRGRERESARARACRVSRRNPPRRFKNRHTLTGNAGTCYKYRVCDGRAHNVKRSH